MANKEYVQKVYHAKNLKELNELYTAWAHQYDHDMTKEYGWLAPQQVSNVLMQFIAPEAKILDAGCGTGLLGEILSRFHYHNLTGIDFCDAMLEKAKSKKCYQSLHHMELGQHLQFADELFDCIVSIGVFTLNHVGPEGLYELKRILKKNGKLILGIRPDIYKEASFANTIQELNFTLVSISPLFKPMPYGEPEVNYQVVVLNRQ